MALLWFVLARGLAVRAARGIAIRFNMEDARSLLTALFLVFLLTLGFTLFAGMTESGRTSLRKALGLPRRATEAREWALGAALGWGMGVAAILPMAFAGTLRVRFWTDPRAFYLLVLHLVGLLFATLASEMALRGFAFQRLIGFAGASKATAIMAVLLGLVHALSPNATWTSILVTMIGSILLSLAWLRTHGLWLSWGLHFAWASSLGLLFGMPVRGVSGLASVVQTRTVGPIWLTGYDFGAEGALLTAIVFLAGIIVLIRTTSDYAWEYTRPEIVAAGYPVDPEPPAAHVAMEQQGTASSSPALIQIQPVTSQSRSADGTDR